jgi:hypothetical protein
MAAGVVALGIPAAVTAAGFGGAGIGAGTLAAKMMSWTAAGQALMAVGCLSVILEEDE